MSESGYDLDRFLWAQEGVIEAVREELRRGRKSSHWMWFIFPQVEGLGRSATAQRYAIRSRDEASAYLAHPQLGPQLLECCDLLLLHRGSPIEGILGGVDALKLRSSMTLFAAISGEARFTRVLDSFYEGQADAATETVLNNLSGRP